MVKAVLYVGHGSRDKGAIIETVNLVKATAPHVNVPIQEIAFLELHAPSVLDGIKICVEQGATSIVVTPLLLLSAKHAKVDIPNILRQAQKLFPSVSFLYAKPLGLDKKMIDLMEKRFYEKVSHFNPLKTSILLVGRGSSDPEQKWDLETLSQWLSQRMALPVHPCFLTAADPLFSNKYEELRSKRSQSLVIIPYLFFYGTLMKDIQAAVEDNDSVTLCDPLGTDVRLRDVLLLRVYEQLGGEIGSEGTWVTPAAHARSI